MPGSDPKQTSGPEGRPNSHSLSWTTREHKPRAHGGVDHPITEFGSGQIVKAVTGAVADDDVFGIDGAKFGNRLSDVVVVERRHDVKPANDGEHLINA